jgi:hypothetical protein
MKVTFPEREDKANHDQDYIKTTFSSDHFAGASFKYANLIRFLPLPLFFLIEFIFIPEKRVGIPATARAISHTQPRPTKNAPLPGRAPFTRARRSPFRFFRLK